MDIVLWLYCRPFVRSMSFGPASNSYGACWATSEDLPLRGRILVLSPSSAEPSLKFHASFKFQKQREHAGSPIVDIEPRLVDILLYAINPA